MSKLWLLLLLVAAFQAAQCYPTFESDYLEDPGQSTWGILKETWGKLKDKYTEMGKEQLQNVINKLKEKLCKDQDFEEDFESDEETGSLPQWKLVNQLKELLQRMKNAADAEKEKIKQEIEKLRAKICDKLNDIEEDMEFYDEDDEESDDMEEDPAQSTWDILKETAGKLKDKFNENLEKLKGQGKEKWAGIKEIWGKFKGDVIEKSKEKRKALIETMKKLLCNDKQDDFEEDVAESDEAQEESLQVKLLKQLRELLDKAKKAAGEEREKMKKKIQAVKEKFCGKLNEIQEDMEYEEDDEESDDMEEDPQQSTWDILKETAGKLKDKFKENMEKLKGEGKEKLAVAKGKWANWKEKAKQRWTENLAKAKEVWAKIKVDAAKFSKDKKEKIIQGLRKVLCKDQQDDFEEDVAESDEAQEGKTDEKMTLLQKMKEIMKKMIGKAKEEIEKRKKQFNELRKKFCARLEKADDKQEDFEEDDEGDEERGWFGKAAKGLGKAGKNLAKKMVKNMKPALKRVAKQGFKYLKKNLVKCTPLQCDENYCQSCVSGPIPGLVDFCIRVSASRRNDVTYIKIAFLFNGQVKAEKEFKLGDVTNCMPCGALGDVCVKGLEGKAKSSKGKANVNFSCHILLKKFGVGVSMGLKREDGKTKMNFNPKFFAGGLSDDNEMAKLSDDENTATALDPDEYEID